MFFTHYSDSKLRHIKIKGLIQGHHLISGRSGIQARLVCSKVSEPVFCCEMLPWLEEKPSLVNCNAHGCHQRRDHTLEAKPVNTQSMSLYHGQDPAGVVATWLSFWSLPSRGLGGGSCVTNNNNKAWPDAGQKRSVKDLWELEEGDIKSKWGLGNGFSREKHSEQGLEGWAEI